MAVLNATGSLVGAQLYGPYRASRYTTGTLPTSIGFTGQRADSITGLDYYNARYYDPGVGQFLSVDSVQGNAVGMDPYAYVGGNPETKTDPGGNMPIVYRNMILFLIMRESEIQMESEISPFSDDQDKVEHELLLPETIISLIQTEIQALKQVEMVGMQLLQALEQQMRETETLITYIKQQRNLPRSMKKACKEQYWWSFVTGDTKAYGEQCEGYRIWLEGIQEAYYEKLSAFKQLQEDVNNLYPQ